jgi:hypothetical protein
MLNVFTIHSRHFMNPKTTACVLPSPVFAIPLVLKKYASCAGFLVHKIWPTVSSKGTLSYCACSIKLCLLAVPLVCIPSLVFIRVIDNKLPGFLFHCVGFLILPTILPTYFRNGGRGNDEDLNFGIWSMYPRRWPFRDLTGSLIGFSENITLL